MKNLEIFDKNGKKLNISDVIRNAYFDIPNSKMSYSTYSMKAYFGTRGWYLIDSDGIKQYPDEKWLRISL